LGVRDPNNKSPQVSALRGIIGGGGGNRTHVRGTPVAGFSVCSRLFYLAAWSVSWQPSSQPARKISTTAFGRDGNPAHLTSSLSDRRAEPRERRGYLRSQSVVVIGSCNCLHPINERMTLDTLPTTGTVPRQNLDAPRFCWQESILAPKCLVPLVCVYAAGLGGIPGQPGVVEQWGSPSHW